MFHKISYKIEDNKLHIYKDEEEIDSSSLFNKQNLLKVEEDNISDTDISTTNTYYTTADTNNSFINGTNYINATNALNITSANTLVSMVNASTSTTTGNWVTIPTTTNMWSPNWSTSGTTITTLGDTNITNSIISPLYYTGLLLYNEVIKSIKKLINAEKLESHEIHILGALLRKTYSEKIYARQSYNKVKEELPFKTGIEIAMQVKLNDTLYEQYKDIIPVEAYILFNAPSKEFINNILDYSNDLRLISYALIATKQKERVYWKLLERLGNKANIPVITNCYFLNFENELSSNFIRKVIDNIDPLLFSERTLPDDLFEEKVFSIIKLDSDEIYDYCMSEDFIIKNFDAFKEPWKIFTGSYFKNYLTDNIFNRTAIGKLIVENLIVQPMSTSNLYLFNNGHYSNDLDILANFANIVALLSNDVIFELVDLIGSKNEYSAMICMTSLITSSMRVFTEYELLQMNMYIDRNTLKQHYASKMDKMPGLKLLLELE